MTSTYNRSQVYSPDQLSEEQKGQVKSDFCFEDSDFYSSSYVKINRGERTDFLPLSMFMKTGGKFTHGILCLSAFDGYFITFDRDCEYAVVAHRHF